MIVLRRALPFLAACLALFLVGCSLLPVELAGTQPSRGRAPGRPRAPSRAWHAAGSATTVGHPVRLRVRHQRRVHDHRRRRAGHRDRSGPRGSSPGSYLPVQTVDDLYAQAASDDRRRRRGPRRRGATTASRRRSPSTRSPTRSTTSSRCPWSRSRPRTDPRPPFPEPAGARCGPRMHLCGSFDGYRTIRGRRRGPAARRRFGLDLAHRIAPMPIEPSRCARRRAKSCRGGQRGARAQGCRHVRAGTAPGSRRPRRGRSPAAGRCVSSSQNAYSIAARSRSHSSGTVTPSFVTARSYSCDSVTSETVRSSVLSVTRTPAVHQPLERERLVRRHDVRLACWTWGTGPGRCPARRARRRSAGSSIACGPCAIRSGRDRQRAQDLRRRRPTRRRGR